MDVFVPMLASLVGLLLPVPVGGKDLRCYQCDFYSRNTYDSVQGSSCNADSVITSMTRTQQCKDYCLKMTYSEGPLTILLRKCDIDLNIKCKVNNDPNRAISVKHTYQDKTDVNFDLYCCDGELCNGSTIGRGSLIVTSLMTIVTSFAFCDAQR